MTKISRFLTTLVALFAMTTGAWAENPKVKYALTSGQTITSGTAVEVKDDGGAVVATITYSESGGNDFTTKAASGNSSLEGYTAFTEGNGTNGNNQGGTFYTIVPVYDGTIDVAVVLNADKAFYVEEDGTALTDYNGIKVEAKYYGTYSFSVSAGKSYKFYCAGSKLGFYGFEYTYTAPAAASTPLTPDADRKVWTLEKMPAGDVKLQVEYYPGMLVPPTNLVGGTMEIVGLTDTTLPEGFEKDDEGNIYVAKDTKFTVKAVPDEGFHLVSWSDDATITNLEREFTMGDDDFELTATFSDKYIVTLNAEGLSDEEAANWKAATGDNDPAAFPLENVEKGTNVKVTYTGSRKVIGVKATKAPAAAKTITVGDVVLDITGCTTWADVVAKNPDKIEANGPVVVQKDNHDKYIGPSVTTSSPVDTSVDYQWYEAK